MIKTLDEIKKRLIEQYDPDSMILYGSYRTEKDDAIFLNSIYRGRYPTEKGLLPHGEPSHDDAQRAINASTGLLKGVKTLLGQ